MNSGLKFTTLWANSADGKLIFFLRKLGFDIACKLSPQNKIFMKCQNLFSAKNQKIYLKMSTEILTQYAQC